MLSESLAKVRKERGLTQEALAVKINVVRQTISKWERGDAVPDADMLCKIAEALDVPVAELLGVPDCNDESDIAKIANILSEINEQLAVRNRRETRSIRDIAWDMVLILIGFVGIFVLAVIGIVYFPYEHYRSYVDDQLVRHYEGIVAFLINHRLLWLVIIFSLMIIAGLLYHCIRREENKIV